MLIMSALASKTCEMKWVNWTWLFIMQRFYSGWLSGQTGHFVMFMIWIDQEMISRSGFEICDKEITLLHAENSGNFSIPEQANLF